MEFKYKLMNPLLLFILWSFYFPLWICMYRCVGIIMCVCVHVPCICVHICALCVYLCLKCVHMCVHVCIMFVCGHTCICTYKANVRSFSVSPLYLETELLTWCSLILLDWLNPSILLALLPQHCVPEHTTTPGFYTVVENPNSSSHVCTLLIEPSPQLCALHFSKQCLIMCILHKSSVRC